MRANESEAVEAEAAPATDPNRQTAGSAVGTSATLMRTPRAAREFGPLIGNRAMTRLLRPPGPVIQRHSRSALAQQVDAAEEEEDAEDSGTVVQRHATAKPPARNEMSARHDRDVAGLRRMLEDQQRIDDLKAKAKAYVTEHLPADEFTGRLAYIEDHYKWVIDEDPHALNPAQTFPTEIRAWLYSADWYDGEGQVREDFVRSTMLHETVHFLSFGAANHEQADALLATDFSVGAQHLDPAVKTEWNERTGFQGGLRGVEPQDEQLHESAHTLDEAVTERISVELGATTEQDAGQLHITNYHNRETSPEAAQLHLTYEGIQKLADGKASTIWLGDFIDAVTATTGIGWAQIRAAYLSRDAGTKRDVIDRVSAAWGALRAAWGQRRLQAVRDALGRHALDRQEWTTLLDDVAAEVAEEVFGLEAPQPVAPPPAAQGVVDGDGPPPPPPPPGGFGGPPPPPPPGGFGGPPPPPPGGALGGPPPARIGISEIAAEMEPRLAARIGAPHQLTAAARDPRSIRDLSDTKYVRDTIYDVFNTRPTDDMLDSMKGTGVSGRHESVGVRGNTATGLSLSASKLAGYMRTASARLHTDDLPPLNWAVLPIGSPLTMDQPFSAYPAKAVEQMAGSLKTETLGSLTGRGGNGLARDFIAGMGGAGYEANGDLAVILQEDISEESVLHETGHHVQKHRLHVTESSLARVPLTGPKGEQVNLGFLLELHNILLADNAPAMEAKRLSNTAPEVTEAEQQVTGSGATGDVGETNRLSRQDPNPLLRLRYQKDPVRLPLSEWNEMAAGARLGRNYANFKQQIQLREIAGEISLLGMIEAALSAGRRTIYPPAVQVLFKNLMLDEIGYT